MKTNNRVRKQRHRSAEEWRRLVSAWKVSGKTRRVWCREQGLNVESLRRWTKRFHGSKSTVSLVEISHQTGAASTKVATGIRITRGGDVELSGHIGEELLRTVLRVVRESARVS
jgi:hypothetical protein